MELGVQRSHCVGQLGSRPVDVEAGCHLLDRERRHRPRRDSELIQPTGQLN